MRREYSSTATLFCVVRNDRPRHVTFDVAMRPTGRRRPSAELDARAWLGGVPIDGATAVKLERGLYPLTVQVAIGWTRPWGKVLALPRLVEVTQAGIITEQRKQQRLAQFGAAADPLRRALRDPDWRSRYNAMWIVAALDWEAQVFAREVEAMLDSGVPEIAQLACEALARIDDPSIDNVRSLLNLADDPFNRQAADRTLQALLRGPEQADEKTTALIARLLFKADGRTQVQLANLATRLEIDIPFDQVVSAYRSDPARSWFVTCQMIEYGAYPADAAVTFIAGELKTGTGKFDPRHIRQLCRAAVRYGPQASPLVPLVRPLLQHGDAGMRRAAVDLLGAIGPDASAAAPEIRKLGKTDKDKQLRAAATRAVSRIE